MFKKKKTDIIDNNENNETEVSSRDQLMSILTNSIDDVFIVLSGDKLQVEYVSPNIERVLGVPAKEVEKKVEILGKAKYMDDKEVTYRTLKQMEIGSSFSLIAGREHGRTKEQRFYSETVYHVSVGDTHKYVVLFADRTNDLLAKQSLEEALAIAKIANQSKTTFLANMSHDIRTPMNTIVGLCTLLQRDIEDRDKLSEHVKHIMLTSRHMLTLINDILDMSKIESGETTLNESEISISELVKELSTRITPQAKAKRLTFNTTVAIRDDKFLGDKLRIKRVLSNILLNAVQYTPDGGKIEFGVQQVARPSLKYIYLQFTVKDNGIGMSQEFVKRIFEPFSREMRVGMDAQGTGLGMSIVKNLVDLMGGTITVDTKEDSGTKVVVSLKFALSKVTDTEFWMEQGISRILVVGNNNIDNNSITWAMRQSGVTISNAKNLKAAQLYLEKAASEGKGFNIVLFDWRGGDDCLKEVKDIRDNLSEYVPLVAIGGGDWTEAEEKKAMEAGVDAFLPKPFLLAAFKECIIDLRASRREGVPPVQKKGSLVGKRFLAAEDNELNAMVLVELLKMKGASCVVKPNGQETLDEFLSSKSNQYDGILMDIQMPVMDGYEATRRIRVSEHARAKDIPIIAMTANAFAEDVQKSLDAGMNAHLLKPVDMNKLEALFADVNSN